jgi:phage-related protein
LDADGAKVFKEEWDSLGARDGRGPAIRTKLRGLMDRYKAGEMRPGSVDDLGDGLRELRIKLGSNPYRVIFFNWGPDMVALTCFYKNQRKTPKADIDRAKRRREEWVGRRGEKPDR